MEKLTTPKTSYKVRRMKIREVKVEVAVDTAYQSEASRDVLVDRLGPIEHMGPQLIQRTCTRICQRRHKEECDMCPLAKLERLIQGREVP